MIIVNYNKISRIRRLVDKHDIRMYVKQASIVLLKEKKNGGVDPVATYTSNAIDSNNVKEDHYDGQLTLWSKELDVAEIIKDFKYLNTFDRLLLRKYNYDNLM